MWPARSGRLRGGRLGERLRGGAAAIHPYRPESDLDRGACGDGSNPSALAALAAIASINLGHTARGRSWPMPSTLIIFAPAISLAVARPPE